MDFLASILKTVSIFQLIGFLVVGYAGFWLRGYMLRKNPALLQQWIDQGNALGAKLKDKIDGQNG
jgi:uncharacterized membrane protein YdjX (TVP38/TMEM64 family)